MIEKLPTREWHDIADQRLVHIAQQRGFRIIAKSLYAKDSTWKIFATDAEIQELKGPTK